MLMRFLLAFASVAVIVGVVIVLVAFSQPLSFGFVGYEPLAEGEYGLSGIHVFTTAGVVGCGVLTAGVMALVFWSGLLVGSRHLAGGA